MKIEFYLDKTGTFLKVIYLKIDGGQWKQFDELTPEEIEAIFTSVCKFKIARKGLLHLSKFMPGNKKDILKQYVLCNWTKLDNKLDISDSKLLFENVSCPFKSNNKCPYSGIGIICIKH